MSVKIRLARHGKKASPFYHIVAADSRSPRDGKYIEKIGTYNPKSVPAIVELDFEKALSWLQKGAQPSDTARSILQKEGVLYKKHLIGGVAKGAFDEATATKKFENWIDTKRQKDEAEKATLIAKKTSEAKSKFAAETKIKEDRIQAILKKNAEMEAAAKASAAPEATEAPAESAE